MLLDFPYNRFGQQDKSSADEISEFCQVNYGLSFPMFDKVEVNGASAHTVFTYLKSKPGGSFGSNIRQNFTKPVLDQYVIHVKI